MKNYYSGSACEVSILKDEQIVRKKVYYTNQGIENGHDKLLNEAAYINRLNKESNWFPQILDQYYMNHYLIVELEYLFDGHSFADIIFDDTVDDDYLIKSLDFILNKLFSGFYISSKIPVSERYWKKCYIERTRRRMDTTISLINNRYTKWHELKDCILNGITINNIRYGSVYEYLDYIEKHIHFGHELPLYNTYRTHHDLIPENIMVDCGKTMITDFKLIDPRSDNETGADCRHFIYDMGKMMFGLDNYGLFRRTHHKQLNKEYTFEKVGDREYILSYFSEGFFVKRIIRLQQEFLSMFNHLAQEKEPMVDEWKKYLWFAFAFMYIPDIPCRVIDEQNEKLSLEFYARGILTIHKMMLEVFSKDVLSSDSTGDYFQLWYMKDREQ